MTTNLSFSSDTFGTKFETIVRDSSGGGDGEGVGRSEIPLKANLQRVSTQEWSELTSFGGVRPASPFRASSNAKERGSR